MNTPRNFFLGDAEHISRVDVDTPLKSAKVATCRHYHEIFQTATKAAVERNDEAEAAVFSFLGLICSFKPTYETPATPYGPRWRDAEQRSLIPEDISDSDLDAVKLLAGRIQDQALRARLNDILWIRRKDRDACAKASEDFIISATALSTDENGIHSREPFQRGLFLSGQPGRDKPLHIAAKDALLVAIGKAAASDKTPWLDALLGLAHQWHVVAPEVLARLANDRATRLLAQKAFSDARGYFEREASLWKATKQTEKFRSAKLAEAETYVNEAEHRTDSAMIAARLLRQGILALRPLGVPRDRIDALRRRLSELQAGIGSEMKIVSESVDLSHEANEIAKNLEGKPLREAVEMLALLPQLVSAKRMRESTQEMANKFPELQVFTPISIDENGRTIGIRRNLLELRGKDHAEELERQAIGNAAQCYWPIRCRGQIEPGMHRVFSDHHPTASDLAWLVRHNPVVPPRHAPMLLRGIHAGFHGDMMVACHLLVPQLEQIIRHVLESNGIPVTALKEDQTEQSNLLGAMLGKQETLKIFGEDWVFELRGCLIEKTGWNFRNRLAHGQSTQEECFSVVGNTLWWLALRLLVSGLVCNPPTTGGVYDAPEEPRNNP